MSPTRLVISLTVCRVLRRQVPHRGHADCHLERRISRLQPFRRLPESKPVLSVDLRRVLETVRRLTVLFQPSEHADIKMRSSRQIHE